jgi:magnesium chelatase accessory protein
MTHAFETQTPAALARRAVSTQSAAEQNLPPADWPNRALSHQTSAGGLGWHVQRGGAGPKCLLIHGTGASTHSWGGLLPLLTSRFECLAPDLPGHGFSDALGRQAPSLPRMSMSLAALLEAENFKPEIVIGHSAGAALAINLALEGAIAPRVIVGLNAALLPYDGWLAPMAQPLAKMFSALSPVQALLASRARRAGTVERLIASTGSRLDAQGIAYYRQLLGRDTHVEATLKMMANWDLVPLMAALPRLATPVCLVVGESDHTISPEQATTVREALPLARVIRLPDLGHLAHEERPAAAFDAIEESIKWSESA